VLADFINDDNVEPQATIGLFIDVENASWSFGVGKYNFILQLCMSPSVSHTSVYIQHILLLQ